jgi:CRISPR-associated protein Cas1
MPQSLVLNAYLLAYLGEIKMILIIDRRDTVLRYQTGCICIEQADQKPQRAAINQLEQVIVIGNPMAETAVWRALAEANVPTVMLSARGEPQAAMLGSGLAVQLPLRRLQHRCANQASAALALAKYFVDLKLQSYDLSLQALIEHHHADASVCLAFKQLALDTRLKLTKADSIAVIMGLEGQQARAWFALLARYLPARWKFTGRNRQPPKDPVNALLSLGYTLLMSDVRQSLISSGFDPSLGFLHQDAAGRESLALDFTEIFRAGVDCFVLTWLATQDLDDSDFYYRTIEGCRLSKQARPKFFGAWAAYREQWHRPFATETQCLDAWAVCHVQEQINGQIAKARETMKTLEL